MGKFIFYRRVMVTIVAVLTLSLSLTGCETLRKKFTRQKKKGQEESTLVPVLEPQDYPAPENNPVESYKQHYDLIKAWYVDLWTALDDPRHDYPRQVKYTIKEIVEHIDGMQKLLKPEKQADIAKLRSLLDYYAQALESAPQMRNVSRIKSDLHAFDRQLRDHLRFDKVKDSLIPMVK